MKTAIQETDWEPGLPPRDVLVDAFIQGQVRQGRLVGGFFCVTDCTHPMQNSALWTYDITHWRYRDPVKKLFDFSILPASLFTDLFAFIGTFP